MKLANKLSTLATFDELRRCEFVLSDGAAEIEFLRFARSQENCRVNWLNAVKEAQRLQRELDMCLQKMASFETKLYHARRLLEMESKSRKEAEKKIGHVREMLINEFDLNEADKNKFAFLYSCQKKRKSKRMEEKFGNDIINSTDSFLSDLSVTQSEDGFLDVDQPKVFRKHRPSNHDGSFVNAKRSRTSIDNKRQSANRTNTNVIDIGGTDKIVASTKVSIPQGNGPIHAESIIEAIPQGIQDKSFCRSPDRNSQLSPPRKSSQVHQMHTPSAPPLNDESQQSKFMSTLPFKNYSTTARLHSFTKRPSLRAEPCLHCQKKIRFGTITAKCRDCRIAIHIDCIPALKIVCVPQSAGTPTTKGTVGVVADYAPSDSPMVPAIIVHCVNEIEQREHEVGLYRVSGSEKDIKALKERFLRGKTLPSLKDVDIHVLCGCIKDFLLNLREPLIPTGMWKHFSNAAQNAATHDEALRDQVYKLPQANRDTLAFLILHFLKIAEFPDIKMPITNLSKVFGPTIVGYSSANPDQHAIYTETVIQANVMEKLLNIASEFWCQFLSDVRKIRATASDRDELTNINVRQYIGTPSLKNTARKQKFYATPPYPTKKK